jgi:hypothetical protein
MNSAPTRGWPMSRDELVDLLRRSSHRSQYVALRRAVDWLSNRLYLSRTTALAARSAIGLAERENAPELLIGVAVMLVPEGWDGQVSFGKGLKRSVLFSPGFIEFGDERPIEAEHELPAIALAIAAVRTRP